MEQKSRQEHTSQVVRESSETQTTMEPTSMVSRAKEYVTQKIKEADHFFSTLAASPFSQMNDPRSYQKELDLIKSKYATILERETYFEEHPTEELIELRKENFLSNEQVEQKLSSLTSEGETKENATVYKELLNTIFDRIETETGFLDSINDTIGIENLKKGEPGVDAGVPIHFGKKSFPKGAALHTGKSILMEVDNPTPFSLIQELATDGKLTSLDALHHELVHEKDKFDSMKEKDISVKEYLATGALTIAIMAVTIAQRGDFSLAAGLLAGVAVFSPIARLMMKYKEKSKTAQILTEGHAYSGSKRAHTEFTTDRLAEQLAKNYGFNSEEDIEKLYKASDAVQRLYALGLGDTAIGELVHQSLWDKKERNWPALLQAIETNMAEKNVTKEGLEQYIREQNVRYVIDKLKVKKIAQEEIARVAEKSS